MVKILLEYICTKPLALLFGYIKFAEKSNCNGGNSVLEG